MLEMGFHQVAFLHSPAVPIFQNSKTSKFTQNFTKCSRTWTVTLSLCRSRRQWNELSYCRNIFLIFSYFDIVTQIICYIVVLKVLKLSRVELGRVFWLKEARSLVLIEILTKEIIILDQKLLRILTLAFHDQSLIIKSTIRYPSQKNCRFFY